MTRKSRPPGREFRAGARTAAVMLAAVAAAAVLALQDAADPAPQAEVLRHVSTALGR